MKLGDFVQALIQRGGMDREMKIRGEHGETLNLIAIELTDHEAIIDLGQSEYWHPLNLTDFGAANEQRY